ncbi:hypothetical protein FY528_13475 [Hymenobacter lutimineralis]|uniref:Uncharacterized protein n=1 Tax=Hymenobacter lutimineralis TaxID=2606448 RepID=A0A5D6V0C2_9BACT|nr:MULTISPECIES: hypothetical protein [Hymenobacter]QIX63261.1 hypothetical protein HER32_19615 [Hymenobacter sp. BT18]TYZ08054.1 hypothetical protein FY528_13475 [Hymenobacter lutimineralis]
METNVINTPIDPKQIPGWGVDADPKNDPTYPMRTRMNVGQDPDSKHRPTLQHDDTEKLRSIERPNVSAVYGTTVPPSGLSGMIRRVAFHYSENRYRHWLPLVLADRVNVVEGIIDDLIHGTVPNIYAEKGYPVEWKHNRTSLILKLATVAALAAGTVVLLSSGDKKPAKRKGYQRGYNAL